LVQIILAASFVVWLIFFPSSGDRFAWQVTPQMTAMFIGAGFIVRTYIGYFLFREHYWYRLRWQKWGNYGFLAFIFLATFWHMEEMNWHLRDRSGSVRCAVHLQLLEAGACRS
jgi:hypothetical protein